MSWLSRIARTFRSNRLDRDLNDELRFHLEAREQEHIRRGASPEDAAAAARSRFGSTLRLREESREAKLVPWLESLIQDARYGWRALRKSPAVTASAVLSLSLAMGACVAAFALLDALVLRPLPVRDAARLVLLTYPGRTPGGPDADTFTSSLFERFRENARNHVDLFAVDEGVSRIVASGSFEERIRAQSLSGAAFRILGIQPAIGHLFTESDDQPLAVLSHAYWTRRFAADPAAIGRSIRIGIASYQIAGVAPRGFTGLEPGTSFDLWLSKATRSENPVRLRVFGRLKPGVAPAQAREVLQPAFTDYRRDYARGYFRAEARPDEVAAYVNARLNVRSAATGLSRLREQFERPLWILALIAALVLLISCSNVANLFTARAAARERELALRASIGAGRGRLIQQVLVEGCLLAAASCALGLAVASAAAPAIVSRLTPAEYPAHLDLRLDWRLAAFIFFLELIAVLLFGLIPALRACRVAPNIALKSGAGHSPKIGLFRPIVAVQVGFSFVVLFVASLLLHSYHKLTHVDLGFSPDGVVLVTLNGTSRFASPELLDHIRSMPMATSAALSWWPLLGGDFQPVMRPAVRIPGHETVTRGPIFLAVSPGFFETMRIPLVEGRDFRIADANSSSPVIVNQTFVRRYLPPGSALGRRFARAGDGGRFTDQEIAGVVRDTRYKNVYEEPQPLVFYPLTFLNGTTLQVRTASDPLQLAAILRQQIPLVDPALQVAEVSLQSTRIENTLLRQCLLALLSGFFALVALVLAAVGLYGVLSYSVVRRTKELGIRVALGARRAAMVRLVIGDVALAMALGLAAGVAGSLALSRFVTAMLYDVEPSGFWSVAAPLACFLAATSLVALGPALRAARTDPLLALRCE